MKLSILTKYKQNINNLVFKTNPILNNNYKKNI